jgi:hypothetical protein
LNDARHFRDLRRNREAGAIFLLIRAREGAMSLYGPAPQIAFEEGAGGERRFALVKAGIDAERLDEWMAREARFDSDFWLVELELGDVPLGDLITVAPTGTGS